MLLRFFPSILPSFLFFLWQLAVEVTRIVSSASSVVYTNARRLNRNRTKPVLVQIKLLLWVLGFTSDWFKRLPPEIYSEWTWNNPNLFTYKKRVRILEKFQSCSSSIFALASQNSSPQHCSSLWTSVAPARWELALRTHTFCLFL